MQYEIKRAHQAQEEHPFYTLLKLVRETKSDVSIKYVEVKEHARHHHNKATEIFYILSGFGAIELDDRVHPVFTGDTITVRPPVRHKLTTEGTLEVMVLSSPPCNPADEFHD